MQTAKVFLAVLAIVIFAAFAGRILHANANGPSKENYADLSGAKEDQEVIAETREAHEQFMAAKKRNEERSARLAKDGYKINWANMTLEPIPFQPGVPSSPQAKASDYKEQRLQEMASAWKGTVLEPHTVMLLSMLIQEDGTLTAERRHDCDKNGICFAIGFQGHHICHRGTPLVSQAAGKPFKKFCSWKNGVSPQKQFEKEYPGFAFDWHVQFAEYTLRMTQCIDAGKTVNQCIQSWNPREEGRIAKVKRHNQFVKQAVASRTSLLTSL